jgi:hypothetical protein
MKGYWEHRAKLLKLLGRELTARELEFAIELYFMGDKPRTVAHYLWEREGR